MAITLAQAIRNAIAAEHAAEKFYLRLAQSTPDEKARQILLGIAAQEREHAAGLEDVAKRLVAGTMPERADKHVNVIESAPGAGDAENLSLREALEIAVDAENGAILYYDALATTSSGDAAIFFEQMGKEEEGHAVAIRKLLEQAV